MWCSYLVEVLVQVVVQAVVVRGGRGVVLRLQARALRLRQRQARVRAARAPPVAQHRRRLRTRTRTYTHSALTTGTRRTYAANDRRHRQRSTVGRSPLLTNAVLPIPRWPDGSVKRLYQVFLPIAVMLSCVTFSLSHVLRHLWN